MSECEHVELLKTYQYDRQKNITGEYWICVGCKLRFVPMGLAEAEAREEIASLTEKVEIEHEQVCQFIRDMYTGRFAEREKYYWELPQ